MHGGGFSRRDRAGAILAALFILILGAASLTKGVPKWGDDFAAYISEGIAIADGSFREQAVRNYDLHPAQLAEEAGEDGLVYVWGYPLMLAGIYKLAGFNRVDYSTMIWYKIPLLLSLSLLGAVLVLFYRRRFPLPAAVTAALLMCMSGDFFKALNNLYSDLPFLFFSMLTLLLAECYADRVSGGKFHNTAGHSVEKTVGNSKDHSVDDPFEITAVISNDDPAGNAKDYSAGDPVKKSEVDPNGYSDRFSRGVPDGKTIIPYSVFYGLALWFTHEIRLNGMAVCAAALAGHVLILLKNRTKNKRPLTRSACLRHAFPYVLFAVLTVVTERIWLAPATSNLSDVGRDGTEQILTNICYYRDLILGYLDSLPGIHLPMVNVILIPAVIIGILFKGLKDNQHLTLLVVGTLAVDIMLPYRQGLRYIYNILPFLLMFAACGLQIMWGWIRKSAGSAGPGSTENRLPLKGSTSKIWNTRLRTAGLLLCVCVLILPTVKHMKDCFGNLSHWGRVYSRDVYAPQAVEMYNYIQENVPEEARIAFGKPRALYLNTNRMAIRTGFNGHRISDADYYLEYLVGNQEFLREKEEARNTPMEPVHENKYFRLYKVTAR